MINLRFKLRGKLRTFVVLTCIATVLFFIIYKTLIDEVSENPTINEVGYSNAKKIRNGILQRHEVIEDVNDLMPITQSPEHLKQMRQQEAQMMRNLHNMINQRLKETLNKTKNDTMSNTMPSLWSGINDNVVNSKTDLVVPMHALQKRFVHLDLKGAPPTLKYLRQLFPVLKSLGATGLLMEYEDMFPYWGALDGIKAYNSYSVSEIAEIRRLAQESNLEIIPLVQTFGHMEFILKHESFKYLREVQPFPQAICPSNNQTYPLIQEMIDQVLTLHPNSKHIHIGCDEVYNIGECPRCQERLEKFLWNTENLFLNHAITITQYVKTRHNVQPIMWDDMFRQIPEDLILSSNIGKYTDILVWKYGSNVGQDLTASIWQKYANCFTGIWIASAFKGATLPNSFATPIDARLENHKSWMQVVTEQYYRINFRGIFLTGWQRYDHFAVLCELLPSGLPSLAVNLQYLQYLKYDESVQRNVQHLLGCNNPVFLELNISNPEIRCSFPGSRIYELSLQFFSLNYYLKEQFFESNYILGWVSDYNVKAKFSSPPLIEQAMMRYNDGVRNVSLFQNSISIALSEVYDKYTVAEWIEINIKPLTVKLEQYVASMKMLLLSSVWPRRPLIAAQADTLMDSPEPETNFNHASDP